MILKARRARLGSQAVQVESRALLRGPVRPLGRPPESQDGSRHVIHLLIILNDREALVSVSFLLPDRVERTVDSTCRVDYEYWYTMYDYI